MRIGIISDLHFHLTPWKYEYDPNTFYICAGDLTEDSYVRAKWIENFNKYGISIMGNHDYYYRELPNDPMEDVVERVFPNGMKLAGATLWSDLSVDRDWYLYKGGLNDYGYIRSLTREQYMKTHITHRNFLFQSNADIIVSHHTPSHKSIAPKFAHDPYNASFSNNLDEYILALPNPPKLWIHGHTHSRFDYMLGKTRVICNPRGYRHETETYNDYKPVYIDV